MRTRFPLFILIAAIVPLAFLACGDDDDDPTPTPGSGETATPGGNGGTGEPLSDEEYLAVICTGLADYTAAIIREREEEGIRQVVLDYIDSLEAVNPPPDVAEFHQSFIAYLEEAIEHPTNLLATPRPLPPEDVRDRLADKEQDVDECRDATFFAERAEDED